MNLETIPFRVYTRWTGFVVALIIAGTLLAPRASGLIPVLVVFAFLVIFRPELEVHRVTDAEIEEWLSHG